MKMSLDLKDTATRWYSTKYISSDAESSYNQPVSPAGSTIAGPTYIYNNKQRKHCSIIVGVIILAIIIILALSLGLGIGLAEGGDGNAMEVAPTTSYFLQDISVATIPKFLVKSTSVPTGRPVAVLTESTAVENTSLYYDFQDNYVNVGAIKIEIVPSILECFAICFADITCEAVNFDAASRQCYVIQQRLSQCDDIKANPGFYHKRKSPCRQSKTIPGAFIINVKAVAVSNHIVEVSGYCRIINKFIPNGDGNVPFPTDVMTCTTACNNDNTCVAFDFNFGFNQCFLHNSFSKTGNDCSAIRDGFGDLGHYTKSCCPVTTASPGVTAGNQATSLSGEGAGGTTTTPYCDVRPNVFVTDGQPDEGTLLTVERCRARCANDSSCTAFDYNAVSLACFYHNSVSGTAQKCQFTPAPNNQTGITHYRISCNCAITTASSTTKNPATLTGETVAGGLTTAVTAAGQSTVAATTAAAGYCSIPDYRIRGGRAMPASSIEACKTLCDTDQNNCVAADFNLDYQVCYIHNTISQTGSDCSMLMQVGRENSGITHLRKQCCSVTGGMTTMGVTGGIATMGVTGSIATSATQLCDTLNQAAPNGEDRLPVTEEQCRTFCLQDPTCVAADYKASVTECSLHKADTGDCSQVVDLPATSQTKHMRKSCCPGTGSTAGGQQISTVSNQNLQTTPITITSTVKTGTVPAPASFCKQEKKSFTGGLDVGQIDLNVCESRCQNDNTCIGFDYNVDFRQCFQHTTASGNCANIQDSCPTCRIDHYRKGNCC